MTRIELKQSPPLSADEKKAYDLAWNMGEMAGGTPSEPLLKPYGENARLQEAFDAGWAEGLAWWLEKNKS